MAYSEEGRQKRMMVLMALITFAVIFVAYLMVRG